MPELREIEPVLDVFDFDQLLELNTAIASYYHVVGLSANLSPSRTAITIETPGRLITTFSVDEFIQEENELHRNGKRSQFSDVAITLIDKLSLYVLRF
ncbi:MAG: hypothetical protein KME11_04795 [Timaviella obliquedivisa GSE-PSE-MK23-08B]|jgi:hypothetical protein|nr:hypothetical protein [Timaviella obliquedivisa GSE-PSE-MK23-08B]